MREILLGLNPGKSLNTSKEWTPFQGLQARVLAFQLVSAGQGRKRLTHSVRSSSGDGLWRETQQTDQIKSYLGHKSMSSTKQYLNESDSLKAQELLLH